MTHLSPQAVIGVSVTILVVILAVYGQAIFARVRFTAPEPTPVISLDASPVPVDSEPVADGVGQKTYTNAQYHFSFVYPENWNVAKPAPPEITPDIANLVAITAPEDGDQIDHPMLSGVFSVNIIKKSKQNTLNHLIELYPAVTGGSAPEVYPRTIGDIIGTQVSVRNGRGNVDRRAFFFERDEYLYDIESEYAVGAKETDSILEHVLASFQFD